MKNRAGYYQVIVGAVLSSIPIIAERAPRYAADASGPRFAENTHPVSGSHPLARRELAMCGGVAELDRGVEQCHDLREVCVPLKGVGSLRWAGGNSSQTSTIRFPSMDLFRGIIICTA